MYEVESYMEHDPYTQSLQPRWRVVDANRVEIPGNYDRGQRIAARAYAASLNGQPLAEWLLGG